MNCNVTLVSSAGVDHYSDTDELSMAEQWHDQEGLPFYAVKEISNGVHVVRPSFDDKAMYVSESHDDAVEVTSSYYYGDMDIDRINELELFSKKYQAPYTIN